ncbi:MAG: hypothetical protein U0Z26_00945 [Anaerolineales bacterium]
MILIVMVLGIFVILITVGIAALLFIKSNQINLTGKTEEKPEWMQSNPPAETIAATKAEGEGFTLYNHDEGEHLAAPFAEQIEDILRAKLEANSELKNFKVDLGSSENGDLEFWVNDKKYASIDELPSESLKTVVREAVKTWESKK